MQLLSMRDDFPGQTVTLDQACHHKDTEKMQMTAEKPKQDTNMKKTSAWLLSWQIVQPKINSFRKLPNVKGESLATTKKVPTTVSKATKAQCEPVNTISIKASNTTAAIMSADTKSVSTMSKNTLVQPPIQSLHRSTHGAVKQSLSRPLANVTVRKGSPEKESHQSEPAVSVVKTSSSQDTERDKALSRR